MQVNPIYFGADPEVNHPRETECLPVGYVPRPKPQPTVTVDLRGKPIRKNNSSFGCFTLLFSRLRIAFSGIWG